MVFLDKIDWNVLNIYIDNGLITSNKHPDYDIWNLNYTSKVKSKKLWDAYTSSCRGLIIDIDGNVLARPFTSFKNLIEHDQSEIDELTKMKYEIFDKIDGTLIILFYYSPSSTWITATRGSFISSEAILAKKIMNSNAFHYIDSKYTYLFELISPDNRNVVNYGDTTDLILLSAIDVVTGDELSYDTLINNTSLPNYFKVITKSNVTKINSLFDLKIYEESNKEGFVIRFENNYRIKFKFLEYVRLNNVLSDLTDSVIWEFLKDNNNFDLFSVVTDSDLYAWLQKTKNEILSNFHEVERLSLKEFITIFYINGITNRTEFASIALNSEYFSILIRLYDKKPYDDVIWNIIKPNNTNYYNK